jgi:hypothetical protein
MTPKKLAEVWCATAALGGFKPAWSGRCFRKAVDDDKF